MTRKPIILLSSGGVIGGLCAGLWAVCSADMQKFLALLSLPGQWLRTLSLSGLFGNLLAWAIVIALSALPLLLWFFPRRQTLHPWEEWLLFPACVALYFGLYYMVNPTLLHSPIAGFFPLAALCTAGSLLASWLILRLLKQLTHQSIHQLAHMLRLLLVFSAILVAFASVFAYVSHLIQLSQTLFASNVGNESQVVSTLLFEGGLMALKTIPSLLGGVVLLLAADLTAVLGRDLFGEDAVHLCQTTAHHCRQMVQLSLLLSVAANLLQLLFFSNLLNSGFSLELPLLTLIFSVALFLLCQCIQRGKELQDENQSII